MQGCQKDEKAVNGEIEITDSKKLLEKARGGLLKLSVSLGIRVMQMLFEEEAAKYAGPKGKHHVVTHGKWPFLNHERKLQNCAA